MPVPVAGIEIIYGDFIRTLFVNRDSVIAIYSKCKSITYRGVLTVPCGGTTTAEYFDSLISKKDIAIDSWYKRSEQIVTFFSNFYSTSYRSSGSGYALVTSDFLVQLAISMLSDTTVISSYAIQTGTRLLKFSTSYPVLLKHNKELQLCKNKVNSSTEEFLEILILSTNNKAYSDSLLRLKVMPLHYRAKLGDAIAEDSLIRQFVTDTIFSHKINLVFNLGFVGSLKCQKALITQFNAPVYGYCRNKHSIITIKPGIIECFYHLYPDIPVISNDYTKYITFQKSPTDTVASREYIQRFLKWAEDSLKVEPVSKTDNYNLNGICP